MATTQKAKETLETSIKPKLIHGLKTPRLDPGRGTNMTELKKRDRGMERATNITRQKPRTTNSEAQENTKHNDQDNFYQRNKQQVQNQT